MDFGQDDATGAVAVAPSQDGTIRRDENGRYLPGSRGGPGRVNGGISYVESLDVLNRLPKVEVRRLAREADTFAVRVAAKDWLIADSLKVDKSGRYIRGESVDRILDRTIGKPVQQVQVDQAPQTLVIMSPFGTLVPEVRQTGTLTHDELQALGEGGRAALLGAEAAGLAEPGEAGAADQPAEPVPVVVEGVAVEPVRPSRKRGRPARAAAAEQRQSSTRTRKRVTVKVSSVEQSRDSVAQVGQTDTDEDFWQL